MTFDKTRLFVYVIFTYVLNQSLVWVFQQWYDHYLQWNQSDYPGVKNLRFTPDQVWTPDILLYNR